MRQYVYVRATSKQGGIPHFAEVVGRVLEGEIRQIHPSVIPEGGDGLYWASHKTDVHDGRPERVVGAYAGPFAEVMGDLHDRGRFAVSLVIVTEHTDIDDLCGYYFSPGVIATIAALGWDIDIDVVRQLQRDGGAGT